MATVGQQLTAPESGWQRYDDADTRFIYTGDWLVQTGQVDWLNGTAHQGSLNLSTAQVNFKFYGSKLRIIGLLDTASYRASDVKITIDGVTETYSEIATTKLSKAITYEKTGLISNIHTVIIHAGTTGQNRITFDAIDIDDTGYLLHPLLNQVSSLSGMKVGDCIPCRYTGTTSGAVGTFSELGTCTVTEIPVASSATPNGLFYFIKTAKGTLVSDRVIQHSISWDVLNSNGFIEGKIPAPSITTADNNTSLNYNTAQGAYAPRLIVFNNQSYATWHEYTGTYYQIRVKKFDGTNWVSADNNTCLNYNPSTHAYYPFPIVFNNQLYVTWYEANQIRIKKFDGTTWVSTDNNTALNYDSTKVAQYPVMTVFDNQLYLSWQENNGTVREIRVKKFDGTNWVSADNNICLNYNPSTHAYYPFSIVFNNQLYVTWYEANQIRIKKFDGTNWVSADNNTSLNYDTNKSASNSFLIVFSNQLYATWQEYNASSIYQIRVKKFDGTNWTFVDGGGANGLNYDTTKGASYPVSIVFNNRLYILWNENNSNSISQIRVKKFDGTSWFSGDNNTSLNYDTTKSANNNPVPTVFNDQLYITWSESNGTVNLIRIKKMQVFDYFIRSLSGGVAYVDANGNSSITDQNKGGFPNNNGYDANIVNSDLGGTISKGNDAIWHWSSLYSWHRDTPYTSVGTNTTRIYRGKDTVYKFATILSSTANTTTGFRPVLTYIEPDGSSKQTTNWY